MKKNGAPSSGKPAACPCRAEQGAPLVYAECCGRYHPAGPLEGQAPTAEALMRSRYSAFALGLGGYLLATWHAGTRPAALDLGDGGPGLKWLGLQVLRHEAREADHAIVEFVARSKQQGRAHRLHEVSRFVREGGRWFYVDALEQEPR